MVAISSSFIGWTAAQAALLSVALFAASVHGPAQGEASLPNDQHWDFSLAHANPLHCLLQQAGEFDVTHTRDHRAPDLLKIIIERDQKTAFQWDGHAHSVFQIVGNRLYFADYSIQRTGGAIVAVDLTNGKTLWREKLQALGPIEHSKYFNRINLRADADSIRVTGNESAGRYIEVKETATGRTVANHKLPPVAAAGS